MEYLLVTLLVYSKFLNDSFEIFSNISLQFDLQKRTLLFMVLQLT